MPRPRAEYRIDEGEEQGYRGDDEGGATQVRVVSLTGHGVAWNDALMNPLIQKGLN